MIESATRRVLSGALLLLIASVAAACAEDASPPEGSTTAEEVSEVPLTEEELAYAIALGEALENHRRDLESLVRIRPEEFDREKLEALRFRPDASGRSLAQQAPVPFSFDRAGWRAEWAAPGREALFGREPLPEGAAEEIVADMSLASVWRPIAFDYHALLNGVLRSHEHHDKLGMLTVAAGGMLIMSEIAATVPNCQITEEFKAEYKKLAKKGDFDGLSRMCPACIEGIVGDVD